MKKILILTVLLFSIFGNAQQTTPQTYSFSLEQAISHALTNNYSAINANRAIAISKQKKRETTAMGLPQVNAGVGYQNFLKQPITLADFNQDGINEEFVFGTKQNMNANVTLNQLLFDGSYIVALQASKTYLKFFENAKQKNDTEIREMVINSYGNVLLAEESILIFEKNKTILEKTLFDTKETFKNGLIEEENVEQLQITLASVISNLNNVKRLKDIAYKMLKINLGIEITSDLKLTDKLDTLAKTNLDLSLSQNEFEINNNADYKMILNFEEQRKLELKLEKSKYLPSLSSFVNYGATANNDKFNFFNNNQKWFDSSLLGINLNVPIFSGFARSARTQQAKIALDQAKTQLTETEQKIKLQYENAKSQFEFSVEQYNTSKSNLSLAERIEKKQQIKFKEGLSSSFDFTEAQRQLYTTQQTYLQSMVDVITKKASLEKIINKQ